MKPSNADKVRMRSRQYRIRLFAGFIVLFLLLHIIMKTSRAESPILISHRGAAGSSAENTLASVQRAIELGAPYIEIDVRRTQDNVLVLLHDRTVNRTTNGQGKIVELTMEQVRSLDATEPIPTLEETLEVISTTDVHLVIELKAPSSYAGIEKQIVTMVEEYALTDRVTVVSFEHDSLKTIRALNDKINVGYLFAQGQWMPDARETELVDVFWTNLVFDPTFMWRQRRQNREVWVWTVDNRPIMRLLLWLGADGITTNYPERWPVPLTQ